jgi:hypothetical protein
MLKVTSYAAFFRIDNFNTPFEEGIKSLTRIIFKVTPISLFWEEHLSLRGASRLPVDNRILRYVKTNVYF